MSLLLIVKQQQVSTHSHPKVAAKTVVVSDVDNLVSTHSHPKVAAKLKEAKDTAIMFQHTATRRWLQYKDKY